MGQFSMTVLAVAGSNLSGNQQDWVTLAAGMVVAAFLAE
jgi:hypothetical protein